MKKKSGSDQEKKKSAVASTVTKRVSFSARQLQPGQRIAIVGPTGAGKSRLLEDIECLADGDTPTGRRVLINGEAPERFPQAAEGRLVEELLFCMENKSPAGISGRAFASCSFLVKFHQTMDGMTDQIPNGLRSQA